MQMEAKDLRPGMTILERTSKGTAAKGKPVKNVKPCPSHRKTHVLVNDTNCYHRYGQVVVKDQ